MNASAHAEAIGRTVVEPEILRVSSAITGELAKKTAQSRSMIPAIRRTGVFIA